MQHQLYCLLVFREHVILTPTSHIRANLPPGSTIHHHWTVISICKYQQCAMKTHFISLLLSKQLLVENLNNKPRNKLPWPVQLLSSSTDYI